MDHGYPAAAVAALADRLAGSGSLWVVGGSTGLAIRGGALERAPRDVDIYADEEDVPDLHARLAEYALDGPVFSRTDKYRSILSRYSVERTVVELVGAFRIEAEGSLYRTDVRRLLFPAGDTVEIRGRGIRLVPLAHELVFNVLRGRLDRCTLVGGMIGRHPDRHLPALLELLNQGGLTRQMAARVRGFAALEEDGTKAGLE